MQTQTNWDRHRIVAEIKRRHGTLSALARQHGINRRSLSVVFSQPYEAGERIIAKSIDQELHLLWPDRWDMNGNRLGVIANASAIKAPYASQKLSAPLTKTDGVLT